MRSFRTVPPFRFLGLLAALSLAFGACLADYVPYCGDGVCNGAETPKSCPQECPTYQSGHDACLAICGEGFNCCEQRQEIVCVPYPEQCP